jgi:hypothetical protein
MPESRQLYASAIRVIIQLTVLALINWLLTELPMIKAISIPGVPVTLASVISLAIGIIMIVILLVFRGRFVAGVRARSANFPELNYLVSDAITITVILIAYNSFEHIIRPFMKEYSWTYAPVFLLIALWPLISFITALYRSTGPAADWISAKFATGSTLKPRPLSRCGACGRSCSRDDDYCPECGARLASLTESSCDCTSCGAPNRSANKYCTKCGVLMPNDDQYDTQVSI